jgi:hypothetical protein
MEDTEFSGQSSREADPVEDLRIWLEDQGGDPSPDDFRTRLSRVWDLFAGSDTGGMRGYKLANRLEAPHWISPILEFDIERHGVTALGSCRAELQHWRLDFDLRTARLSQGKYRIVRQPEPHLDIKRLAREIANIMAVEGFLDDPRIKRLRGNRILIVVGEMRELTKVVAQTRASRRTRFRMALAEEMSAVGFQPDPAAKGSRAGYQFSRNTGA